MYWRIFLLKMLNGGIVQIKYIKQYTFLLKFKNININKRYSKLQTFIFIKHKYEITHV